MTAHTEGPWRVSAKSQTVVADHPTGWDDPFNVDSYGGHLVAESVRIPANLHLIVAAPTMLDSLRQWAWAEQNNDAAELANARQSRDDAIRIATQEKNR